MQEQENSSKRADQALRKAYTYYKQELGMAYAYRTYVGASRDPELADALKRISLEELGHAEAWKTELEKAGVMVDESVPISYKIRAHLASIGWRILGSNALRANLHKAEREELRMYNEMKEQGLFLDTVNKLTVEEENHLTTVAPSEEDEGGRFTLRNFIFGINDGFISELALLAGVSGATSNTGFIVLAGVAMMVAEGVAMGAGAYLSSKSQKEMYQYTLKQQRERAKLSPTYRLEKLIEYFRERGLTDEEAKRVAQRVTSDEKVVSKALVEDELGLSGALDEKPVKEGFNSTIAYVVGGVPPLAPYFFMPVHTALVVSVVLTVSALFVTGALKSAFTGKNWVKSGLEMAVIGAVAAGFDYMVGGRFAAL